MYCKQKFGKFNLTKNNLCSFTMKWRRKQTGCYLWLFESNLECKKNPFGIFFVIYKNPYDVGMRTCLFPLWCLWNLWCVLWNLWSWDVMTFMELVYVPLWCLWNLWCRNGNLLFSLWCLWNLWSWDVMMFMELVILGCNKLWKQGVVIELVILGMCCERRELCE